MTVIYYDTLSLYQSDCLFHFLSSSFSPISVSVSLFLSLFPSLPFLSISLTHTWQLLMSINVFAQGTEDDSHKLMKADAEFGTSLHVITYWHYDRSKATIGYLSLCISFLHVCCMLVCVCVTGYVCLCVCLIDYLRAIKKQ